MVIGPYVMAMSDAVTAFFSVDVPAPRATSLHSFVGEPQMLAAVESMFDPTTSVRVLHSDRYDCIAAPAPPPGCTYILRCRGVPVMITPPPEVVAAAAAEDRARNDSHGWAGGPATQANSGRAGMCLVHVAPSNAEGLGYLELVPVPPRPGAIFDAVAGESPRSSDGSTEDLDPADRPSVAPVLSISVFLAG